MRARKSWKNLTWVVSSFVRGHGYGPDLFTQMRKDICTSEAEALALGKRLAADGREGSIYAMDGYAPRYTLAGIFEGSYTDDVHDWSWIPRDAKI